MDEWQERRKKEEARRLLREQTTPTKPTQPQKCPEGEEWNEDLHQCVKIVKPTPTKEQIPAQPVVPVGPVTIEQKVAALNDKIAEIEKLLSNLYGLTGHSLQEVKTVLGLK